MSHELTIRENGFVEHAYYGEVGWHGLGNKIVNREDLTEWKSKSGFDFTICRSPVEYEFNGEVLQFPDREILHRCDNGMALGIVSPSYKIVQPAEVLEFFRDLIESAGFKLTTAGTLYGGKRYWAQAEIGEKAMIVDGDIVKGYLMVTTGADGTTPTIATDSTTRVVCMNTMNAALSEKAKRRIKVSHRNQFDAAAVKDQLGIARGNFAQWVESMRKLAAVKVSEKDAAALTLDILAPKPVSELQPEAVEKVQNSRAFARILSLFNGGGKGAQMNGVAGTAWGLMNAFTEHVDYWSHAHSMQARFESAQWGDGDKLKTKACEKLLTLA
jgi:phage/plasmid-like protein (TIGR03299 family)